MAPISRALALLALACVSCALSGSPPRDLARWQRVSNFACQLQNLDPAEVGPSGYQLLIMDFSRNGRWDGRYREEELTQLRQGGRLLLAYLSLGEAESYRDYWGPKWRPGNPAWLGAANGDWKGNYKVHYWDPAWRELIIAYAKRLLSLGYDGLFLDVVDAHEHWLEQRPQAPQEMIDLILALTQQVRESGYRGIILNGGEELIDHPPLLQAITGVAKEEIFFGLEGDDRPSPPQFTQYSLTRLKKVVQAGRLVLSIDYSDVPQQIQQAHRRARRAGFLEYVTDRGLDRLRPLSENLDDLGQGQRLK